MEVTSPRTDPPTRRQIGRALFNTLISAAGFAVCVVGPSVTWTSATWTPTTWRPSQTGAALDHGRRLSPHARDRNDSHRSHQPRSPARAGADGTTARPAHRRQAAALRVHGELCGDAHCLVGGWLAMARLAAPAILSRAIAWAGLAIFAAGWWLVLRALETNAFAVRVVRHQPERGHRVIDAGVYRIVRHPMYAGLVGVMIGAALARLNARPAAGRGADRNPGAADPPGRTNPPRTRARICAIHAARPAAAYPGGVVRL